MFVRFSNIGEAFISGLYGLFVLSRARAKLFLLILSIAVTLTLVIVFTLSIPLYDAIRTSFGLFLAYIGVVGLIISAGAFLRGGVLSDELRNLLGSYLSRSDKRAWTLAISNSFLYVFDRVYRGQDTLVSRALWFGLILSMVILALARIIFLAAGDVDLSSTDYLILAIVIAFGMGLMSAVYTLVSNHIPRGRYYRISRISLMVLASLSSIGLVIIFAQQLLSLPWGKSGLPNPSIAGLMLIAYVASFAGLFFISVPTSYSLSRLPINPLKAMLSSLCFVVIVGLASLDSTNAFFRTVQTQGWQMLSFIAFNIFADGISLLETRWVLQKGGHASVTSLLGWLTLDIILSAAIFLILPLVLWPEILSFGDAVLFKGERPWLGILFWSTFSTSVLFYLFVIAVLIFRVTDAVIRVLRIPIDIQREPVTAISLAMVSLVTVGFLFGVLLAAIWSPAQ